MSSPVHPAPAPARTTGTGSSAPARVRRGRRPGRPADRRLALALPAGALLIALAVWPLVQLGRMSLHEVTAATLNSSWAFVGLDNYSALLGGPDIGRVALNTLAFVVVVTLLGMAGGFVVAVAVLSSTRGGSFLLGLMVFAWALPPVVNGSIWKFLLADQGLVNTVLRALGLDGAGFLYDPSLALWSVALVNAWAVIPFNALVLRAALLGVDPQVLEAAELDGARPWRRVWHILLPSGRAAATVLTILTIVYAFRSFDFIYVMTSGGPGTASTTLPFLAYAQAFLTLDYGRGAATALMALVVVVALALVYARDVRKTEGEA
ncbi:sugar ABC transporter permease [Cellulomonas hominis]|uniref:carbohydrate ABC transporter permease n=1 Tax=Cellulomonas hominis TaxID=156981 RepID=UPI001C12559B|nr:sugar ABC transporter permease [Cellulomonas hominis]MBU5421768.1 sugar ABC transporter permease [Cellulomonas hominis]